MLCMSGILTILGWLVLSPSNRISYSRSPKSRTTKATGGTTHTLRPKSYHTSSSVPRTYIHSIRISTLNIFHLSFSKLNRSLTQGDGQCGLSDWWLHYGCSELGHGGLQDQGLAGSHGPHLVTTYNESKLKEKEQRVLCALHIACSLILDDCTISLVMRAGNTPRKVRIEHFMSWYGTDCEHVSDFWQFPLLLGVPGDQGCLLHFWMRKHHVKEHGLWFVDCWVKWGGHQQFYLWRMGRPWCMKLRRTMRSVNAAFQH